MLLQASEEIAKKYGGNKQKIAQAVQSGLLNATEAVLAGMFIDRVRDAAALEQVPEQTIAEQTFAPKAPSTAVSQMQLAQQGMPPQGMGGTSQAAQMQGMPPQGPQGMGGTSQAAQMQAMQQRASRPSVAGIDQLSVNSNMVANAASGGLVAFAGGGEIQGYATGTESTLGEGLPFQMSRDEFSNLVKGGMSEKDRKRLEDERYRNELRGMERAEDLGRAQPYDGEIAESPGLRSLLSEDEERGMYDQIMPIGFNRKMAAEDKLFEQEMAAADRTKANIELGRAQPYNFPGEDTPGTPVGEGARVAGGEKEVLPDTNAGPILIPITGEATPKDNTDLFTPTDTGSEYEKAIQLLGASDDRYENYLAGASERADSNRKEDFYTALTQFGFNLAASGKPTLLQAAGEAGVKTMPTVTEAIKEQRKTKASAEKELASVGAVSRAQNIKLLEASMVSANAKDKNKLAKLIADERNTLAEVLQKSSAATQLQVASIQTQNPTKYENRVTTYLDTLLYKQRNGDERLKGQPREILKALAAEHVATQDMAAARARIGFAQSTQDREYIDSAVKTAEATLFSENSPEGDKLRKAKGEGDEQEATRITIARAKKDAERIGMGSIFDAPSTDNESSLFGMDDYSTIRSFNELPESTQNELSNTVIKQGGVRSIADPTNQGKEIAGIPVFNANGDITAHIKQSAIASNSRSVKELEDAGYKTIREDGVIMGFIK